MPVISIGKYRDRETRELLSSLIVLSDHQGGSVLVVYRSPDGKERMASTGIFKADPAKAVLAATRISVALAKG